ncbi:MAG: hypothetical protein ABFS39_06225, partial [Pseudomonadota bacterium]
VVHAVMAVHTAGAAAHMAGAAAHTAGDILATGTRTTINNLIRPLPHPYQNSQLDDSTKGG